MTRETLAEAVRQLGLERVLNSRGTTYRKLGLKDMKLNEDELFDWLQREQGMIKRPLIEKEGQFLVGYDEEAILDFTR